MIKAPRSAADVAGVILAGGKASRLDGRAKALIPIHRRTILERIVGVVAPRVSALAISANDPELYQSTGLRILPDSTPDQGPVAGLAAALDWCRRPYLLAVAADMPFVDPDLVDLLLSRRAPDVDIVAPFVDEKPQPLFALYSRRVLPVALQRLAAGQRKAADLVLDPGLRLVRVHEPELRKLDPELLGLTNINTPEDLARAMEL